MMPALSPPHGLGGGGLIPGPLPYQEEADGIAGSGITGGGAFVPAAMQPVLAASATSTTSPNVVGKGLLVSAHGLIDQASAAHGHAVQQLAALASLHREFMTAEDLAKTGNDQVAAIRGTETEIGPAVSQSKSSAFSALAAQPEGTMATDKVCTLGLRISDFRFTFWGKGFAAVCSASMVVGLQLEALLAVIKHARNIKSRVREAVALQKQSGLPEVSISLDMLFAFPRRKSDGEVRMTLYKVSCTKLLFVDGVALLSCEQAARVEVSLCTGDFPRLQKTSMVDILIFPRTGRKGCSIVGCIYS